MGGREEEKGRKDKDGIRKIQKMSREEAAVKT